MGPALLSVPGQDLALSGKGQAAQHGVEHLPGGGGNATQPGQGLLGTGVGSVVPSSSLEVLASEMPTVILQLLLCLPSLGTWEALS